MREWEELNGMGRQGRSRGRTLGRDNIYMYINWVSMEISYNGMPCPRHHRLINKKPKVRYMLPLLELLIRQVRETPPIGFRLLIMLYYPQELDSKILFLKTSYTWVVEHWQIKLALKWKLYTYWLAFIVLEDAIHATRGGRWIISSTQCEFSR